VPALRVVDEAKRFDGSLGAFGLAGASILKAQEPPMGEGLLEEAEVGLHGKACVGCGGEA